MVTENQTELKDSKPMNIFVKRTLYLDIKSTATRSGRIPSHHQTVQKYTETVIFESSLNFYAPDGHIQV